jgi:alkane 1-monooxygenase
MQSVRAFKYASPLLIYGSAWVAFSATGWLCWLPMLYAWFFIPAVELVMKPDMRNLSSAEEEMAKRNPLYDYFLYLIVPLQYAALVFFLIRMKGDTLHWADTWGRVMSMGLLCGTFGINVAHELGHRIKPAEQWMAKALLLTSLYMHFFTEHNKGHHKRVATPEDPSSARYGEMLYTFFFRTILFSYSSAWHIANDEMRKKGKPVFSLHNEMVQATLIQLAFVAGIYYAFGGVVTLYFAAAALMGILLLETVNYIEHYGLTRKKIAEGKYERALPQHSWNSNHIIGRIMLFELSRHSDHHYLASRKYQILRHHDDAPQMPTGYPGMMLLSLVPPAWFYVMHKKLRQLEATAKG